MIKSKVPITKKKTKQADQKTKILQVGEKLFAEKGFYLATLEEIANNANLAKGTIYLHFANKSDLFISVVEKKLDLLLKKIRNKVTEESASADELKKVIEVQLNFLERNRNFFKILQSLSKEYKREMEKDLTERVIKKHGWYLGIIQRLIEKAMQKNEIRPFDARKMAVILVGIVHSLTINWIIQGEKSSLSDERDLIWDIFWNGAKQI